MNKIYANDILLVKDVQISHYGEYLIITGFQYYNEHSPWMIQKISEKYTTGIFDGALSIN